MPRQDQWESYFDPPKIMARLGLMESDYNLVEIGSGYGTFTIASATLVAGTVFAFDIEPEMLKTAAIRTRSLGLTNIKYIERDVIAYGTGLVDGSADYAMVFNILHTENPIDLLREARRNVKPSGKVGVMHWNYDPKTPRGPPMEIRPRPVDCVEWAQAAGLECGPQIDLPPYHYGFVMLPSIP